MVRVFGIALGMIALAYYFFAFLWPILGFVLACAAVAGILYAVIQGTKKAPL